MLRCWGIEAEVAVRSAGEIDVAFAVGSQRYILEAKWEQPKADTGHVAKLQRRVAQRFQGTVGLFLAMAGYSPDALDEVDRGGRLEVLLLDRAHFEAMLSGFVLPDELLKLIQDRAAFRGRAYTPLLTMLTTVSTPPVASLDPMSELNDGLVLNARMGMSCTALFTLPESDQLGIAFRDDNHLLVTTQAGVVEVELRRWRTSWAVPIANCHRNPLVQTDGSIVFTRRYGVGRVVSGGLSIVGGGFAGTTRLLRHEDGSACVLSSGDLSGPAGPSITKLGTRLGDEVRHILAYPPASASNAMWAGDSDLVITGSSGLLITNVPTGAGRTVESGDSIVRGLVDLRDNLVLTTSDSGRLRIADLTTGRSAEIIRLALRSSGNEITKGNRGDVYLAAQCEIGQQSRRIVVLALAFEQPISEFAAAALDEANRGDLSTFAADVDRLRAATAQITAETDQQRLVRLYNEALNDVQLGIYQPLKAAIESAGLRPGAYKERPLDGWPPTDYGGAAAQPRWGIETLRSPWLVASVGVVHRAQPAEDLNDLAVTIVLTQMSKDGQRNYIARLIPFEPGALRLAEIINKLRSEIEDQLPSIIRDFLTRCAGSGVPR